MSDWYDAAKKHFNSVTGRTHQAFADAARDFYDSGGDSSETPTAAEVTATAIAPGTATNVQGILTELAARIAALEAAP